jgi:hypothetical protein
MKKIIIRIAAVLFTSMVSYLLVVYLGTLFNLSKWLPNSRIVTGKTNYTLTRLREAKNYANIDVLFLGSSLAFRGVDTRPFQEKGLKVFNLGTSAQTPYNSYFLLKEFSPKLRPKYVVLDMYWTMMNLENPTESTIDIMSNHQLTSNIVEMAFNTRDFTTISSLIANYISRLHTPLHELKDQHSPNDRYIRGGYVEPLTLNPVKQAYELSHINVRQQVPAEIQINYLNKIIDLCRANNIKPIFIMLPVTKELKSKVSNYPEYCQFVDSIADNNKIPFTNYNERKDLSLTSLTDFVDENHMSKRGATKFTRKFIDDLDDFGVKDGISAL